MKYRDSSLHKKDSTVPELPHWLRFLVVYIVFLFALGGCLLTIWIGMQYPFMKDVYAAIVGLGGLAALAWWLTK